MFCNNCGKEISDGNLCGDCSKLQNSLPIKKQEPIGCVIVVLIIAIVVIVMAFSYGSSFGNKKSSSANISKGINITAFDTMAKDEISKINTDNVIERVETRINSTTDDIAYVYLYLSDNDYWDSASNTEKKEFVSTMGNLMDIIGSKTKYSGTTSFGVGTHIMSKNGIELAERDAFGDIKLK